MGNIKEIFCSHTADKISDYHMPLRVILSMVAAIFLCEVVIMFILTIWPVEKVWISALIDSTILIVLLIPFLYFFCYSPMNRTINAMKKAESELREYQNNLERLVKERTRQLENANAMAALANQAKSDFFANISHELRTPLNSILGFSDLMLHSDDDLSDTQRGFLSDINNSGRQLLEMVTKILDMSELISGKNHLNYGAVSVNDLINDAIALTKEESGEKGINIDVDMDENIGTIKADNEKLSQVMANLLSNAVKFTEPGGNITISSVKTLKPLSEESASEYLEISVRDTGPGIRAEEIDKIFSPFQQTGPVYSREHGGAGISLAVCKYFIEAHGGAITVESEFGKGCNFIVSLPIPDQA